MRLLIVDDSVVFRSQIKSAVESSMSVDLIQSAANGKIALQKLEQSTFDVMTLDMEMPELNGLETLKEIRAKNIKIKVIVFAAQNAKGASFAMEALRLGAMEVVSKPDGTTGSFEEALAQVKNQLVPILKEVDGARSEIQSVKMEMPILKDSISRNMFPHVVSSAYPKVNVEVFRPKVLVIGSSTGGPSALESIFSDLKAPLKIPILIVQHMPPFFTASLASRIASLTGAECTEGTNGEMVKPGKIYVAPGDFHMGVFLAPGGISIKLSQGPKRCSVRPAVDSLFEDASTIYEHLVGAMVLTGMGEDGMLGCQAIKARGGAVVIQDKETAVVWGMPGAVHASGAYDKMGSLQECARLLSLWTK